MVLPRSISDPSPHDPLLLLPLPSRLPASPTPSLPPLLDALSPYLDPSPSASSSSSASSSKIPMPVLTAQMRLLTRNSQVLLNAARVGAAEARARLDDVDVELREVEYERARVKEEIERCEEYEPAYRDLDLVDREEYLKTASPEVLAGLRELFVGPDPRFGAKEEADQLSPPAPTDDESYEYTLTIARLEHELAEIQAREALAAALTKDRDALIRAKKEIKHKFDAVDVYLADFAKTTNAVASKVRDVAKVPVPVLSAPPIELSTMPLPDTESETIAADPA